MKVACIIPARYQATRFPGKLVQDLGGKPVIVRTFERAVQMQCFDEIIVATDSDQIEELILAAGGTVFRSQKDHPSGSDRIAEVAALRPDLDIIINIQGDEPFTPPEPVYQMIEALQTDPSGAVVTVAQPLSKAELSNPSNVKVVVDLRHFALYFSRAPIPYIRDGNEQGIYYEHMGLYGFRREALLEFASHPPTPLEQMEKIEALRFLEMGKKIKIVFAQYESVEIDTPEDLETAKMLIKKLGL
jgi:3-deoxy-manno-octulosonate cytidylyltransferase (CMP-KDO synthetase)